MGDLGPDEWGRAGTPGARADRFRAAGACRWRASSGGASLRRLRGSVALTQPAPLPPPPEWLVYCRLGLINGRAPPRGHQMARDSGHHLQQQRSVSSGGRCVPSDGLSADVRAEVRGALGLSPREFEVALSLVDGLSRNATAMRMKCSKHTVDTYTRRIFAKLGVNSRTAVVGHLVSAVASSVEVARKLGPID